MDANEIARRLTPPQRRMLTSIDERPCTPGVRGPSRAVMDRLDAMGLVATTCSDTRVVTTREGRAVANAVRARTPEPGEGT